MIGQARVTFLYLYSKHRRRNRFYKGKKWAAITKVYVNAEQEKAEDAIRSYFDFLKKIFDVFNFKNQ